MTKRILFFESDAGFAADVAERLRRHGAEVEVTDDGNAGVDAAAQNRPDLILLTIELPQVNGFLVCKKLKKSPETASIPIIILSSEATEEIFEQHRKLRTRAEDYLRKPISLDTLIERVRTIIPLDNAVSGDSNDDVIAISEELDVSFDQAQGTDLHQAKSVDPDIDAFADSAFDALVVGEEEHTTVGQIPAGLIQSARAAKTAASTTPPAPPAPAPVAVAPAPRAPTTPPPAAAAPAAANAELERKLRDAEAAVVRAENRARAAEEQSAALEKLRGEVTRLEKEIADTRKAASSAASTGAKTGGVSSREFLDLRESLNKKDKENLDLRDQLSARDKQMFELRDKNLAFERTIADASDKQLELERSMADLNDQLEALGADKEAAAKRAEDFKGRAERSETRVKKLEGDLESEKAVRSADAARLAEEIKSTVETLKAQHEAATETARTEHASAVEALRTEHASTLETLRAEHKSTVDTLRAEQQAALEALRAEHASTIEGMTSNHNSATEALIASHTASAAEKDAAHATEMASAVEALRTELTAARETAVSTLRAELESAHKSASDDAAKKHATAIEESNRKHAAELAAIGRKLAEAENTITITSESLSERETELAGETKAHTEAKARVASLEGDLEKARGKITGDGQILDRARRALEISLALLEDQKSNGVSG